MAHPPKPHKPARTRRHPPGPGCSLQGATLLPSIPDCTTGYVCADPPTVPPPSRRVTLDAAEGLSGCADDALCVIPIFGSTGTPCLIDGDNDGADDKDGFCVELPGDDQRRPRPVFQTALLWTVAMLRAVLRWTAKAKALPTVSHSKPVAWDYSLT